MIHEVGKEPPVIKAAMHDRDLEKFRGGPTKPAQDRMHVTINKSNVIVFNKNAYRQLGKPPSVNLYFSRTRDLIVIEPVPSVNLPESFPLLEKGTTGWRVNAAPFCRHFGILIDTTLKFIEPDIREGKLNLKLSETVSVALIRRKRRKKDD